MRESVVSITCCSQVAALRTSSDLLQVVVTLCESHIAAPARSPGGQWFVMWIVAAHHIHVQS